MKMSTKKVVNTAPKAVVPEDERIYKFKETSSVNGATLVLLFITAFSAYYITTEKHNRAVNIIKHSNSKNITNSTIEEEIILNNRTAVRAERYAEMNDTVVKNASIKKKKRKKDGITNSYDKKIMTYIYDGEHLLRKGKYAECISFFEGLLQKYSLSPRIIYGHAQCLHRLAEKMRSNALLTKAIESYGEVGNKPDVPNQLLKISLLTQARQLIFLGQTRKAIVTLNKLSNVLPEDVEVLNDLGIGYMIMGANHLALKPFKMVLDIDKNNGTAKVHIGFILKSQKKYKESIQFLLEGIQSGEELTHDARFYFHLGDAYTRLGHPAEAWKVYHRAAEKKLFLSAEQRSTYNSEATLRAQPWWRVEETGYSKEIKLLEYHWKTIRDEALSILDKNKNEFPPETEHLVQEGDWRQFELYSQGKMKKQNCARTPRTCAILDKIPDAINNRRGQIKYSIMQPGTHIWPHTGPTNCRLRAHLGLVIPQGVHIRVGSETKTWQNGKVIVIDDSFDHEVWHNGTKPRLIFIIDFWHPDLPKWERETISPL